MIKKIDNINMGKGDLEWLKTSFHFSFADYYNPFNMGFGKLRVLNDDLIEPGTGFDTHPHSNMEIITYIITGKLTHGDSIGNEKTLGRGNIQYMSAGTGIWHSEHNFGNDKLRLLQIWIYPDKAGYKPNYGDYEFNWDDRENHWLHMVSSEHGSAPIKIHQDVNIYTLYLDKNKDIEFQIEKGRQGYLVQIEGESEINTIELFEKDAMEIVEEKIKIKANEKSHFIFLEMKKGNL